MLYQPLTQAEKDKMAVKQGHSPLPEHVSGFGFILSALVTGVAAGTLLLSGCSEIKEKVFGDDPTPISGERRMPALNQGGMSGEIPAAAPQQADAIPSPRMMESQPYDQSSAALQSAPSQEKGFFSGWFSKEDEQKQAFYQPRRRPVENQTPFSDSGFGSSVAPYSPSYAPPPAGPMSLTADAAPVPPVQSEPMQPLLVPPPAPPAPMPMASAMPPAPPPMMQAELPPPPPPAHMSGPAGEYPSLAEVPPAPTAPEMRPQQRMEKQQAVRDLEAERALAEAAHEEVMNQEIAEQADMAAAPAPVPPAEDQTIAGKMWSAVKSPFGGDEPQPMERPQLPAPTAAEPAPYAPPVTLADAPPPPPAPPVTLGGATPPPPPMETAHLEPMPSALAPAEPEPMMAAPEQPMPAPQVAPVPDQQAYAPQPMEPIILNPPSGQAEPAMGGMPPAETYAAPSVGQGLMLRPLSPGASDSNVHFLRESRYQARRATQMHRYSY